MEKKIIIVEGPAGSGKSTLIHNWGDSIVRISRGVSVSRDYGVSAPVTSMIKDHQMLIRAFGIETDKPLVLDRFWFSQMVYETIRQGQRFDISKAEQYDFFIQSLAIEYSLRCLQDERLHVSSAVVFVLPDFDTIYYQRQNSSKEYPFDLGLEFALYRGLSDFIKGSHIYHPEDDPHEFLRSLSFK